MFSRFRNALFNVVGGLEPLPVLKDSADPSGQEKDAVPKFNYCRPPFLNFTTDEEIQVSADHVIRPIMVPRDISRMPWHTGYAEAVNAGKSAYNEDQASVYIGMLERPEASRRDPKATAPLMEASKLPYLYFGVFDGHAGVGASLAAAKQLHFIVHDKLLDVVDHLLPPLEGSPTPDVSTRGGVSFYLGDPGVNSDSLIIGALESAFHDMDDLIAEDRQKYVLKGGCTALVALFILGKLYVANAGDSRAVMSFNRRPFPMSYDFTPETERTRIRQLAASQPELLGTDFTHLDFIRRPTHRDLGRRWLYRDAFMNGWGYKMIDAEDLKIPVVFGEGKRSRVLATIGVTRGFGDHDLRALNTNVMIKPFLTSQPEVKIFNIADADIKDSDVLIMGTDGLWDVTSNERAVEIVQTSLDHFPANDRARLKYRYTSAAQDLVMQSRGKLIDRNWRTSDGRAATIDDISVFVIPLAPYKAEYKKWRKEADSIRGIYETENETAVTEAFSKLTLQPLPGTQPSPQHRASQPRKGTDEEKRPIVCNLTKVFEEYEAKSSCSESAPKQKWSPTQKSKAVQGNDQATGSQLMKGKSSLPVSQAKRSSKDCPSSPDLKKKEPQVFADDRQNKPQMTEQKVKPPHGDGVAVQQSLPCMKTDEALAETEPIKSTPEIETKTIDEKGELKLAQSVDEVLPEGTATGKPKKKHKKGKERFLHTSSSYETLIPMSDSDTSIDHSMTLRPASSDSPLLMSFARDPHLGLSTTNTDAISLQQTSSDNLLTTESSACVSSSATTIDRISLRPSSSDESASGAGSHVDVLSRFSSKPAEDPDDPLSYFKQQRDRSKDEHRPKFPDTERSEDDKRFNLGAFHSLVPVSESEDRAGTSGTVHPVSSGNSLSVLYAKNIPLDSSTTASDISSLHPSSGADSAYDSVSEETVNINLLNPVGPKATEESDGHLPYMLQLSSSSSDDACVMNPPAELCAEIPDTESSEEIEGISESEQKHRAGNSERSH